MTFDAPATGMPGIDLMPHRKIFFLRSTLLVLTRFTNAKYFYTYSRPLASCPASPQVRYYEALNSALATKPLIAKL